jgi:long-chain acyl-CoA synthetase
MNATERFQTLWNKNHDKLILSHIDSGREFTHGEVAEHSMRTAQILKQQCNLVEGDRVMIVMENFPETIFTFLACIDSNFVAVPVNPQLAADDFKKIVGMSDAKLIVSTVNLREKIGEANLGKKVVYWDFSENPTLGGFSCEKCDVNSEDFLSSLLQKQLIEIMYTSGSSGVPKAVPMVAEKILGNGYEFVQTHNIKPGQVFLNQLPLCYLGGWYNLFIIPFLAEGRVLLDRPFGGRNTYAFWGTIAEREVTALWLNPTMVSMLLKIGIDEEIDIKEIARNIEHAFVGMAPLTIQQKQEFEDTFGIRMLENYGLSETFFLCTQTKSDNSCHGSVGRPLDKIEFELRDSDNMKVTSTPGEGEVWVKSPFMIDSYAQNSGENHTALIDGYFRTGDIASRDSDGNITISGRIKDIIIRGGINISPKEVEEVVIAAPEVVECCVFGAEDKIYGEKIIAAICLQGGASVLPKVTSAYCKENLAIFKRPAEYWICDSLPKNSSGKIDKRVLIKQYLEAER